MYLSIYMLYSFIVTHTNIHILYICMYVYIYIYIHIITHIDSSRYRLGLKFSVHDVGPLP